MLVGATAMVAPLLRSDRLPPMKPIEPDLFMTMALAPERPPIETIAPGTALYDSVVVEQASVKAARELAAAGHAFAIVVKQRFDHDVWKRVGFATYAPREGITPSEALRHLLDHPESHRFECGTAVVIHGYLTLLELKGAPWFDREMRDLEIGPWKTGASFWKFWRNVGGERRPMDDAQKAALRPGYGAYVRSWDVSVAGYLSGWQGENVVYLGRDADGDALFYGHPFGIDKGEKIVEALAKWRKRGGATPSLQAGYRVLHPGLAR